MRFVERLGHVGSFDFGSIVVRAVLDDVRFDSADE